MSSVHSNATLQPHYSTPVTARMDGAARHLTTANSTTWFHTSDRAEESARGKKKRQRIWSSSTLSTSRVTTTNGLYYIKHSSPREISWGDAIMTSVRCALCSSPPYLPALLCPSRISTGALLHHPDSTSSTEYGPDYHLGTTVQDHTANNQHMCQTKRRVTDAGRAAASQRRIHAEYVYKNTFMAGKRKEIQTPPPHDATYFVILYSAER